MRSRSTHPLAVRVSLKKRPRSYSLVMMADRSRTPGMMLLIGLAITVAFTASMGASLRLLDHELNFWWELAVLCHEVGDTCREL